LSAFAEDGSDIFHVPDAYTNTFSVQSQSTQGAEVTTDAPATNDVTLTINTHKVLVRVKAGELLGSPEGTISSQAPKGEGSETRLGSFTRWLHPCILGGYAAA
jgi:hypothetical protein